MKKILFVLMSAFALNAIAADLPKKPDTKKPAATKKAEPKKDLGDKKPTPKKKKA
jgi:hypothetical protein